MSAFYGDMIEFHQYGNGKPIHINARNVQAVWESSDGTAIRHLGGTEHVNEPVDDVLNALFVWRGWNERKPE